MTRRRTIAVAVLGAAAVAATLATAWRLSGREQSAGRVAFANDGTGLQATDVQAAIQELSARVKAAESAQGSLQMGAAVQEQRLTAAQAAGATHEVRLQGHEDRMGALEARLAEVAVARKRIDYNDGADTTTVGPAYVPLRDLGTFAKMHPGSTVTLTWNTHLDALGEPASFCDFQLRIDGKPDTDREGGGGRAVVYVPAGQQGASSAVALTALFGRVGPGAHTVSAWVRGSARECLENYGNFPRSVLVEEGPRLP
ncbi:MAG TPA: hypothetical protein VFI16_01830 [Anaeromyxobacteraceae bacterium]|nr:hypothetical protein [Anaeromyxobacteraceae bacterium]